MAIPRSLQKINMEVSEDDMHVYENGRSMNELVEKLCKMQEEICSHMQEEICSHMQNLLHESTLAARERGLDWPPYRTQILTPMHQEEEDKGLIVMHAMADDIHHATQAKPSKEKARIHSHMSSYSDVAQRQQ